MLEWGMELRVFRIAGVALEKNSYPRRGKESFAAGQIVSSTWPAEVFGRANLLEQGNKSIHFTPLNGEIFRVEEPGREAEQARDVFCTIAVQLAEKSPRSREVKIFEQRL